MLVDFCFINFFYFLIEREKRCGRQWCDVSRDPPILILTDTLADIQGGSLFPSHVTAANKGSKNKRSLNITKRVTPSWPPSIPQRHRRASATLHMSSSFTGLRNEYICSCKPIDINTAWLYVLESSVHYTAPQISLRFSAGCDDNNKTIIKFSYSLNYSGAPRV